MNEELLADTLKAHGYAFITGTIKNIGPNRYIARAVKDCRGWLVWIEGVNVTILSVSDEFPFNEAKPQKEV